MKDYIGLGDLLNEVLLKLNLAIKDEELLESLNATQLKKTNGLDLIYPKDKKVDYVYSIPQVNAQEILNKVNIKEELFDRFWEQYNKKINGKDCKAKFLRLTDNEIDAIFKTLPHYIKFTPDAKFRKMPMSYLNQRIWEDDGYIIKSKPTTTNPFKF